MKEAHYEGGAELVDASGRPVAIIEITPEGARIKPIYDLTKIGLAVLAATLTVWRATRRRAR